MRAKKERKPSLYQAGILRRIAGSRLIKTYAPERREPLWQIDGDGEISDACARALIRNGWVQPLRDGLSMFDKSQTYLARMP